MLANNFPLGLHHAYASNVLAQSSTGSFKPSCCGLVDLDHHFLSAIGRSSAVAIHFAHRGKLAAELALAQVRPCWAKKIARFWRNAVQLRLSGIFHLGVVNSKSCC